MTVCIAAICSDGNQSVIVGASDRMLTSGDVEFQPSQPKMLMLTTGIVAMIAGDTAFQAEVFHRSQAQIPGMIVAAQGEWLPVHSVAQLWASQTVRLRDERAETALLKPLGLTMDTFIARQQQLAPPLVSRLADSLMRFTPSAETIIAGLDETGAHIYKVDCHGSVDCLDFAGFTAIGSGQSHALSEFMVRKHSKLNPVADGLLLTYSAKRRAEVAPGVGSETDMFAIPTMGGYVVIQNDDVLDLLARTHQEQIRIETESRANAATSMREELKGILSSATASASDASEQGQSDPGGTSSPPE